MSNAFRSKVSECMGAGFGMEVTVISTSPNKEKEALATLGSDHFVVSKDEAQMSVRSLPSAIDWHCPRMCAISEGLALEEGLPSDRSAHCQLGL